MKLNCLPYPEPKLRTSGQTPAPVPFYLTQIEKIFIEKIMVAEEFSVKCYGTILILLLFFTKGNVQGILKDSLEPGLLELEPKFGFAAPWSRSRQKYFRLRNTVWNK
jgi:hypothetical protein